MFTLGYPFRPWRGSTAVADGASILEYIRQTAVEHGIQERIRYGHRVVHAAWSSRESRWRVRVELASPAGSGDPATPADPGGPGAGPVIVELTCDFLFANTGYFRYDAGHAPSFAHAERFRGRIVHPQHWPADLDHRGRRVVVIGSGATAVTLVPALARQAASVTMLQRSPSYLLSLSDRDRVVELFRRWLPPAVASRSIRWKKVFLTMLLHRLSRTAPGWVSRRLRDGVRRQLPVGYDVDTHFTPRYRPWDQRLCIVPEGDLFTAIREGRADVVTDTVECFTERGLRLSSGAELEADVVVTATGIELLFLGGMTLEVDGVRVDPAERTAFRGIMLADVPNLAMSFGYTNVSWTLKANLSAIWVCRLLNHLSRGGYRAARPRERRTGRPTVPFVGLSSGYVRRSVTALPRQGLRSPWRVPDNYPRDVLTLRFGRIRVPELEFTS